MPEAPTPDATADAPGSPVIACAAVSRQFGRGKRQVRAVRGLDFQLAPGEALGLLGHNGSGKSTTIKMVLGLLEPDAGTLEVFGRRAGHPMARAQTGYVPEEARQLGRLTGREAVRLFARLQRVARSACADRITEALRAVGLPEESWRRSIATYSRGMTRRLALATAWVHQPDLLVLDEPTSGLDPAGVSEILALLETHKQRGGAILISTHDRVTTEGICDRVLILSGGQATAEGRPDVLLADDTSPSLEGLLARAEAAGSA